MTHRHGLFSNFREIGAIGLVIIERDGILLRRKDQLTDFTLRDVAEEFIQMLKQLRELNVRFGFISDERGMDGNSHGRSEFAALTGLLDKLLRVRGAMPDFWTAWRASSAGEIELQHRYGLQKPDAYTILQAIEWYRVDTRDAVFVGSSPAAIFAANDADLMSIRYSGWRSKRTTPGQAGTKPRHPSLPEITEVQRLRATIEEKLRLGHRTGVPGIVARQE